MKTGTWVLRGAEGRTLDLGQDLVPLNFPLATTLQYIMKTDAWVLKGAEGHLTLKGRIMCPSISL